MNKLPFYLAISLALAACSGLDTFYDKEYVLYDGRKKTEKQQLEQPESAPQPSDSAAAVARILVLENVLDELNRAIRAGQGDGLIEKRNEVEKELAWRKREAGESYQKAWEQRLAELRAFPTQAVPPADK